MRSSSRAIVLCGVSLFTVICAQQAQAQASTGAEAVSPLVDELVVTAQRREESIQDVPIAMSATSGEALAAQRITTGANLQQISPNLNFTRTFGGGFVYTLRGVGNKAGGDSPTGIHVNSAPLAFSRLADSEFYDIERVEILRGPQGTLYGRNASAGVVNVLTARPQGEFTAEGTLDYSSYDTRRAKGFVNIPINDMLAFRVAGSYLKSDGYGLNEVDGERVNGRDLYSTRVSARFTPHSRLRVDLMWERFHEDDDRTRFAKQLCITDNGPASVGGVATTEVTRRFLTQGCLPGSIYSPSALGQVNGNALLAGIFGNLTGLTNGDVFAGRTQTSDLRTYAQVTDPFYQVTNNLYQADIRLELTDSLSLSATTSRSKDNSLAYQDQIAAIATKTFNVTPVSPGGFVDDPQLGRLNTLTQFAGFIGDNEDWSQDLRLQSNFAGPINFSLGAIYLEIDRSGVYNVFANALTAYVRQTNPAIYVDPSPAIPPSGIGHNYFYSPSESHTISRAVFGELYWKPNEQLQVTLGLRRTSDSVKADFYTTPAFLRPGQGIGTPTTIPLKEKRTTGRFNVTWKPDLSFTDETMLYASYSTGFKGGGVNGPASPVLTYDPENVKAYEIGTKNSLLDNRLQFNATGFFYDYGSYQTSKIVNRVGVVENVDAEIYGVELESVFHPVDGVRLNASLGYLHSEAVAGDSVDIFDRTQSDPGLTYVKASSSAGCAVPTSLVAATLTSVAAGTTPASALLGLCSSPLSSAGVAVPLKGKTLPLAPEWTLSLGAQREWQINGAWSLVARGDYYRQSKTYSRIFNTEADKIKGWDTLNASLILQNEEMGFTAQAYIKNIFNDDSITDMYLGDESTGDIRNIFLQDPRVIGLALTKRF